MSPNSYEVVAVREALLKSAAPCLMTDEQISAIALDVVVSLHEQDLRLTSGGKTPSVDD